MLCRVSPAVRLTGLVVPDVAREVTAAGGRQRRRRRTRVQVLATGRRLDGRDRILWRQRQERLRGLGRMTDPAVGVVTMVMVMLLIVMAVVLLRVLMVMVMVVMMTAVMFLSALDVLQLQVHHVMLSGTTAAAAVVVVDDLVAVQILVTEPVTAERLGGQVVPRLDGLDGAVVPTVRRRRLRLDRVLSRSGRRRLLTRSDHRVFVPVQRVRTQRRRVRRRTVLGQAVLRWSAAAAAAADRRALAHPLVRRVPIVDQISVTVITAVRALQRRVVFVGHVVPSRVAPLFVSLPAVRAFRFAVCEHTQHTMPIVPIINVSYTTMYII